MKSITIRKVPEPVHRQLRIRAAKNGRSLEAELRSVLLRLARIDGAAAKLTPVAASDSGPAADLAAAQREITLTDRDVASGRDDAMKKVRKILREGAMSGAEAV